MARSLPIKHRALWEIAVTANRQGEEAIAELLETMFRTRCSTYADAKSGRISATVYCDNRPAGLAATVSLLRAGLNNIKWCGLDIGRAKISISRIRREDWAESWKRHFKPLEIRNALLIKPSWSKRKPRRGQPVMILDPGLTFGTGHHATTLFCLNEIVRRGRAGRAQSFLDLGTGSGILAIAAAKLGYLPVRAVDFDPQAVRVARENARKNGVSLLVHIIRQDVTRLPARPSRRYDLICANLASTILISERRSIAKLLKPDGVLVLAGILKSEFPEVEKAFKSLGMGVLAGKTEREWRSAALCVGRR